MTQEFRLIGLDADGAPVQPLPPLPEDLAAMNVRTAAFLRKVGYRAPWTGYVALAGDDPVGGGAFYGPPAYGRVEIAYFTLPAHQGRGFAARTAAALVEIALHADPLIRVTARTAPEENASTRILRSLGFEGPKEDRDEEIGLAWLWAKC